MNCGRDKPSSSSAPLFCNAGERGDWWLDGINFLGHNFYYTSRIPSHVEDSREWRDTQIQWRYFLLNFIRQKAIILFHHGIEEGESKKIMDDTSHGHRSASQPASSPGEWVQGQELMKWIYHSFHSCPDHPVSSSCSWSTAALLQSIVGIETLSLNISIWCPPNAETQSCEVLIVHHRDDDGGW